MYPFWDSVIAPLVSISASERVVEIGALRGETTVKMLDDLGPDAELHVIDPLPQFDPSEHERAFPGRYVFHRDLSLNVLPTAGPFDVALIDGDHNWYTVYHELQHLRRAARDAGRPVPLLILHDVGWPYGRRDLYYEPSQIPEEFRQPHDRRGMTPKRTTLLKGGGMNITLDNAIEEGGPRNGVRTALDDWVAEHDTPVRQVILPIYFGLAIVAEQAYLDAHPEVAAFLDDLESHEGTQRLLTLSEDIRLDEVVFSHNIERMRNERLTRANTRYLALLRSSLTGEPDIDNQNRIDYLLDCAARGRAVDAETLRAPSKVRAPEHRALAHAQRTGAPAGPTRFSYADMGRNRLEDLDLALATATTATAEGCLVEVGCGRGGGAIYMRGFLEAVEDDSRLVFVADEFRARPRDHAGDEPPRLDAGTLLTDLNQVREGFERFGLLDDRVRFLQGPIDDTLPGSDTGPIALLRVGPTVDAAAALTHLYDRVVPGGVVIVDPSTDDLGEVERFCADRGIRETDRLDWHGIAWQKVDETVADAPSRSVRNRAPAVPATGTDVTDLSVVVVFYNMSREAKRTLHSLSRGYQRGIDDLAYDVVVVDNGSDPEHRLDAAFVESFGPEFRFVDMGADARPSPTHALNVGLEHSRGTNVGVMIDGAHVLTPGVLAHAMAGLASYEPAVVTTQQWYLGPGQQPETTAAGYDQAEEDRLLDGIEWPSDGYRLFDVGHFIGERDWFDGILESNCLFAPRSLLQQVGGFDDSFSMPGGGYANLELFERLASHPDTRLVTILGEGSFHQVHGGTTTNDTDQDKRRAATFGYGQHYAELRGRTLQGPAKHLHFVGSFSAATSRRTRGRRMTAMGFDKGRPTVGVDAVPAEPRQIPDELVTSFIDAYWHGLAWQDSRWLGESVHRAPTDLLVYQELITRVRPDQVIVGSDGSLGLARYLASICELIGHGAVTVFGAAADDAPGLTSVADAADAVATAGESPHALVILGGHHNAARFVADFETLEPLIRPGSYAVFENTIVNGRPVWPAYGPGPLEAIRQITRIHGDFVQDTEVERHGLTFNRGGFLRRAR